MLETTRCHLHDAAMKAAEGVCNALPCHYGCGCAGGAALALAIISATDAVVIGW